MTCLALLWVRSIVKTLYCMKRTNQRPNPLKNLRVFRGDRGAAYWVVCGLPVRKSIVQNFTFKKI